MPTTELESGRRVSMTERANHPIASIELLILLALNVIMLVVGILNRNECPVNEKIPIFLIAAGAVGILSKLLPFLNRKLDLYLIDLIISLMYLFEIIWTIVGSVWVYQIYKPNYDPSKGPYCSRSAYLLSFWLLTILWLILAINIVLLCCLACLTAPNVLVIHVHNREAQV